MLSGQPKPRGAPSEPLSAIIGFVCPSDKGALSIVPDLDIENAFRYDPELLTDKQREEILDLLTEELADRSRWRDSRWLGRQRRSHAALRDHLRLGHLRLTDSREWTAVMNRSRKRKRGGAR